MKVKGLRNQEQKSKEHSTDRPGLFGINYIMPFIRPYGRKTVIMLFLGFLSSLADTIFPLFNRYALNHFIPEQSLRGFPVFILLYVILLALQTVTNYVSFYMCFDIEASIARDMRNSAFDHIQTLSFGYFNHNSVGYVLARTMSDTSKIGEMVSWKLMIFMWSSSYFVCAAAVMLMIHPGLALAVLILVPPTALLIRFFTGRLVSLNRRIREQNALITGGFNEGLAGAAQVRSLAIEDVRIREFREDTAHMRKLSVRSAHYSALFTSIVTLMSSAALAMVLWRGGLLSMQGLMRIGTLSVFMSYALGLMDPVQTMVDMLSQMTMTQTNIERLHDLLTTQSDVVDSPDVIEKYGDSYNPRRENWEPLRGDVEFRDVTFRYPDGEELVLEHFNLMVRQGTSVAIVGETGAGKSTLVNLVCRFYEPTKGQVLIDGRDARERSQLWLHSNIGYVLQTPHLFSGTIRENLRYGRPEATDEEIWQALRMVSADGVVRSMEKGLDSEVGEGGGRLSTGEKQLLSFARAMIKDPRILILDEATSSVDTVTEKQIQQAVAAVIRGRTSFVIAHRLSTITGSDLILAVQDGKIVEQGTHRQLMRKKGYYYSLYSRQYEEFAVKETLDGRAFTEDGNQDRIKL